MTDREKWAQFLDSFNIPYENSGDSISILVDRSSELVEGYSNFEFEAVFKPDGSFRNVGIWE